jgi:hypothetical protein
MRLRLEDNGQVKLVKSYSGNTRTIYNPQTGEGVVLDTQLGGRPWWKVILDPINITVNIEGKTGVGKSLLKRKQAREQRLDTRLVAKAKRQEGRAERKQTRIDRTVQKQRFKTKKQQEEQAAEQQQATRSNVFEPDSDQIPDNDIYGGDFVPQNQAQEYQQETEDVEYVEVPETDGLEAYEEPMEDGQLGGWVDSVFDIGKKLLGPKTAGTTATTVETVATRQFDYDRIATENRQLKRKIKKLETSNLIYGGSGVALGTLAGVFIGKSLKR